jgi:ribosomal-protein-alanine N-acetyltransferase
MLQFNFSPFPIINTERLHLRRTTLQDDEALLQLRTDDAANKYLDRARPTHLSEMHELLKKIDNGLDSNTAISWAIALKENPDRLIGSISFHKTDAAHHRAEIGYMVMPEHWRKGLVSEAIKAVIAYGFNEMKLHSIEANINPKNEPSRNILLKHDFVKEAYFKENYYYNGKFLDSEIYSLINTE